MKVKGCKRMILLLTKYEMNRKKKKARRDEYLKKVKISQ